MRREAEKARSAVVTFLAIVFGTTWLFQLPAILAQHRILGGPVGTFLPLVVLGYFAPAIAALALARREFGERGAGALLRPFGAFRVAPRWYVLALGHSAAILTMAMILARRVVGPDAGRLFYPPGAPQIAAMLVIPFTEQIPWRGFVYPALERHCGALRASVVVGVLWSLFHLQKQCFIGSGLAPGVAPWMLLLMTAGTVVFTWFHRRSGSMLLVVVANAGVYLDNSTSALPASVTPLAVHAVGYAVVALALVLFDGAAFRASQPAAVATST